MGFLFFLVLERGFYCLITNVSKITALIESGHHFSR